MQLFFRIKKYIFLLCLVISLALGIHLGGIYIYEDSQTIPERGGSLSIGMIAKSPSLTPTEFSLDVNNDFILSFLYKGLLRYNAVSRTMEGDLANCDLGKSLAQVKCYFKPGAVWSDGSRITVEDALSTYSLLAETDTNKTLRSALSSFAITREGDAIVFRTSTPSSESLELFTLPILKKSTTEAIRKNINTSVAFTSAGYTFSKREINAASGVESIILASTQTGSTPTEYNRIVLKIFTDEESLIVGKDGLNFIYPGQYQSEGFGDRFTEGQFLSPNFVSAFLNTTTLAPEKRALIINLLASRGKWGEDFEGVKNPFFTKSSILPAFSGSLKTETDITTALERVGYTRGREVVSIETRVQTGSTQAPLAPIVQTNSSNTGALVTTPVSSPAVPIISAPAPAPATLKFFKTPTNLARSAVVAKDEIILSWGVPTGTTAVFINGYRLKGYESGSGVFSYRARADLRNLRSWQNIYRLAVERAGIVTTLESIEIWNVATDAVAQTLQNEWAPKGVTVQSIGSTNTPSIGMVASWAILTLTGSLSSTGSTWAVVLPKIIPIVPPTKPLVTSRKGNELFTSDGKRAILAIRVLNPLEEVSKAASEVQKVLTELGFEVVLEEIDPSLESLKAITKAQNKTYDLLVTWVNLGYLGTHLSPYFHSGQAQDGFNFSLLRNSALDMLLEELRTRNLSPEELATDIIKINTLLKAEWALFIVGANPYSYFADKIIYGLKIPSFLNSTGEITNALRNSYLRNQHIANLTNKSLSGFFTWFGERLRGVAPEVSSIQDSWKKK